VPAAEIDIASIGARHPTTVGDRRLLQKEDSKAPGT
jgi:hypothetical protein